MWKQFFLPALLLLSGLNVWTQPTWDRPMQLKSCSIDIKADLFTATTFIEMEFYNSNEREIEGLYRFELKPGQVITAFQLDLHGKYRDGSIEEKWKATNAYNTIVGKRIDPALLTMESPGYYSLRIYPVPAKGSRKVTMTIQQLLTTVDSNLQYYLPVNAQDVVDAFKLKIKIESGGSRPVTLPGLIGGKTFNQSGSLYLLEWNTNNIVLKNPIVFSLPLSFEKTFCVIAKGRQSYFALRFKPLVPHEYDMHPKKITVFWDASASSTKRDLKKEINFLRQFVSYHGVSQLTLIPFNHKIIDKVVFEMPNAAGSRWQHYLANLEYAGATQLGCIDLAGMSADMFMLFSDGSNTYGKGRPKTGTALLYAVHAATAANFNFLDKIVGSNGGRVIDLNKTTLANAIQVNSKAENWLLNITSASGKVLFEQSLPKKLKEPLFINGTMEQAVDTLYFHYGNNNRVTEIKEMVINRSSDCASSVADRITMLESFEKVIRSYSWENTLDFGLTEKVVTPNTAFIVLERVEDYIKYNISPPKELEAECEQLNYVKIDTRPQRQLAKEADEYDILNRVVNVYNSRLNKWDSREVAILLNRGDYNKEKLTDVQAGRSGDIAAAGSGGINNAITGKAPGISFETNPMLSEVVVVGYGTTQRKQLSVGSVSYIRSQEIWPHQTVEQALQGRVAGLQVINATGQPGSGFISIRGSRSMNTSSEPLFVLDGIPVSGNINHYINTNDIESITVLKDATAAAVYGSGGANGVVVITSKKGRISGNYYNNRSYRLKDMEDVEYLLEIKETEKKEKLSVYKQLQEKYGDQPGFYLDIAQHFFEINMPGNAKDILMNAIEVSNGSFQVLRAIGYIFENHKQFNDAINVYEQVRDDYPDNLYSHRDLAWAYYQDGQYQLAVNVLYAAIKKDTKQQEWANLSIKAMLLTEMNAIIAQHKEQLNISGIPSALIRPMTVDLRVVLDCNKGSLGRASVKEPGGEVCSYARPVTKKGGMFIGSNEYNYYSLPVEYEIKNAVNGKYKVNLNYYDYYSYPGKIPAYVRVMTFRNFGKAGQSITIENVVMDNQYGELEIAEIKW